MVSPPSTPPRSFSHPHPLNFFLSLFRKHIGKETRFLFLIKEGRKEGKAQETHRERYIYIDQSINKSTKSESMIYEQKTNKQKLSK